MRKGLYFSFARLAIRLLLAIYRNQISEPVVERQIERDATDWLEKYK